MTEATLEAVQLDERGGIDVLHVRDVPRPVPSAGEALVEVRPAGINLGEAKPLGDKVGGTKEGSLPSGG